MNAERKTKIHNAAMRCREWDDSDPFAFGRMKMQLTNGSCSLADSDYSTAIDDVLALCDRQEKFRKGQITGVFEALKEFTPRPKRA